jgi:hypothetical protein
MQANLLKLNLQHFAEGEAIPTSDSWESYLSETPAEVVDDQPIEESETETVIEDNPEVTEDEVTDESEEVSEEAETEETPLFNDDTEIDLGEGRDPVKLAELKNGYLRQSDYTKKTQALADERKAFEGEQAEMEPVRDWLEYINSNPYLMQTVNQAIETWNNVGEIPPIEELLDTEAGPYINHLIAENSRLQNELDQTLGEYQTTRFNSEMNTLVTDLKAEYGELITPEYEQSLRQQAEEQGLSSDVLKRIAKGDLAELKLQQTQQDSKKVEAKTKQKIRETKLPPQPKKVAQQPSNEINMDGDWLSIFKQAGSK